jgi:hypothetical protein
MPQHQMSCRSAQWASRAFERVHIDLIRMTRAYNGGGVPRLVSAYIYSIKLSDDVNNPCYYCCPMPDAFSQGSLNSACTALNAIGSLFAYLSPNATRLQDSACRDPRSVNRSRFSTVRSYGPRALFASPLGRPASSPDAHWITFVMTSLTLER